ncbi:MAG: phosphoribosylformylglycinamidine synthase subunit PurQ [Acidobacteria bacterium]|nr:phosphoribosylformylglycinamidine synthase subunit PurQ [Acidobacteriota bacterium]MBP1623687.1 phosphoribosylformylglycinamidine synthase subunit PurQ [Acidobacteriota bacterium]
MASEIPVLIITGYGLNCEDESRYAWELAGARPVLVHFSDLLAQPQRLREFAALMFIGGFAYGDHMTSGHVFALRAKHRLSGELDKFISQGKLILGACNGFQIMVKLGLLPGLDGNYFAQKLSIIQNDCGTFQDRWVRLSFEASSPCVFTRGLSFMDLPVRHGEGKVFTLDKALLHRLEASGCVPCRYADPSTGQPTQKFPCNPNGALNAIAGLCDPTGRIFGLMPHPEAYLYPENHPQWDMQKLLGTLPEFGLGLLFFRNAVDHLQKV